jgi:hypothetical protein
MHVRTILLAGAALLLAQSAFAKTPEISGNYYFNLSEFCQPVIDPWPSGSTVLYNGLHTATTAVADFDSSTGQVSATGETISGDQMVTNSTAGNIAAASYSLSGAYSNTATTLTLDGTAYTIDYKTVSKGLARSFHFYATATEGTGVTAPNCAIEGNASLEPSS